MAQTRFNRSLRVFGPNVDLTPAPIAIETISVDELGNLADELDTYETPRIRPYTLNRRAQDANYLATNTHHTPAPAGSTPCRDRFGTYQPHNRRASDR